MQMKICTKCGKESPATPEWFHRRGKKGLFPSCKICRNENNKKYEPNRDKEEKIKYNKNYYQETHEYQLARSAEYYRSDAGKEVIKKYREENREKLNAAANKWASKNKDKIRGKSRRYYLENRDKCLTRSTSYHEGNRGVLNANRRFKRLENREEELAKTREYTSRNREKYRIYAQKRHATKLSLPATFTVEQWECCLDFFYRKDAYTGLPMKRMSQDHFIPISRGGEYTINNIVPCEKSINSSKGTHEAIKWFRAQPFYSKQRERRILTYLNYKGEFQQLALM